ncbi:MAG: MCP four helix bundle domain-containing protein, partial [Fibromonadales bacterium]|nr:MCP four helix bundle domain-containing protein [Fibromonadales bacterium]
MNNIKMGPKLIASFLFLAALTAFMGIYTILSLQKVSLATDIMYDTGAVPLGVLVATQDQVQDLQVSARDWRLAKSPQQRAAIMKHIDSVNNGVNETVGKQMESADEKGKAA